MKKRFREVIYVAPWTSLNLCRESLMSDECIMKRKWKELHSCVNRENDRKNRSKND